jgi:hypothetical protein
MMETSLARPLSYLSQYRLNVLFLQLFVFFSGTTSSLGRFL